MVNHTKIFNEFNNAGNGYWSVNDKIFFSKVPALIQATKTKQKIKYHFNDHVYNTVNWGIEPEESLKELYAQRASELRKKYDYLIILYSAGSDSTNMIKTFLENNIKIDHVMSWGSKNHHYGDEYISNKEITIAGSEMIKKIINMGINFTFENYLEEELMEQVYLHEDWVLQAGANLSPHAEFMSKGMFAKKELLELASKGKKICFLWGREKPMIELIRGNYYLVFIDNMLSELWHSSWNLFDYPLHHEYFYQHATTTKLIAKQSHIIIDHLEKNYTQEQVERLLSSVSSHEQHEELCCIKNSLIYKDTWNNATFTTGKPRLSHRPHKLNWFFENENTRQFKIWQAGLANFLSSIDPIYKTFFESKGVLAQFKKYHFIKSTNF